MKFDQEAKKVPRTWLNNSRKSETPQQTLQPSTHVPRQSISPIRKSEAYPTQRGMNTSFTPDSRFFDATQKTSFLNVSRQGGVTQNPLRTLPDNLMGQSSINLGRSIINRPTMEMKLNKPPYPVRSGGYQRLSNDNEIKEIIDNRIQILDSVKSRLKERRKWSLLGLIIFLAFVDYFLIGIFKTLVDGEELRNIRGSFVYYVPMDSSVYYVIVYKLMIYFLILNLSIDTDFYQMGNWEGFKKLLTFKLYPLISLSIAVALLYYQIGLLEGLLLTQLNPFFKTLFFVYTKFTALKILVSTFLSENGKRHSAFTKRTFKDASNYLYGHSISAFYSIIFSFAVSLLVVKFNQIIQPGEFTRGPSGSFEISLSLIIKIMVFFYVYCYLSLEAYLFLARVFLTTDFRNYFPNYKNIKTVLKLYHELQVDSYSQDLDKYIIEKDILDYLRNNLSVIYNNFFRLSKINEPMNAPGSQNTEINWRIINQIFALEMKQVDEIFIRSSKGRNAKYFDFIDSVIHFYDFLFVNDRFMETYLSFLTRYELLQLKFELIKELYIYAYTENSAREATEEVQQLYKHVKNIYDNLVRFFLKFSEIKTNYNKSSIAFLFETLIIGIEDLLQKMTICIERTPFKSNIYY